jgi:hypothetical protein
MLAAIAVVLSMSAAEPLPPPPPLPAHDPVGDPADDVTDDIAAVDAKAPAPWSPVHGAGYGAAVGFGGGAVVAFANFYVIGTFAVVSGASPGLATALTVLGAASLPLCLVLGSAAGSYLAVDKGHEDAAGLAGAVGGAAGVVEMVVVGGGLAALVAVVPLNNDTPAPLVIVGSVVASAAVVVGGPLTAGFVTDALAPVLDE